MDVVKKVKRPPGFPFSLNNALDTLLKKEFDLHRKAVTQHPIQKEFVINAIPSQHEMLDKWRQSMHHGVVYIDEARGLHLYGGIDDLWINSIGAYHLVDYKATAKDQPVTVLASWTTGYKRQMEVYQWLLRKNGLRVSDTAYFVYCTGDSSAESFDNKIQFHTHLIPYEGDHSWVENVIQDLHNYLQSPTVPAKSESCPYCGFYKKLYDELKKSQSLHSKTKS